MQHKCPVSLFSLMLLSTHLFFHPRPCKVLLESQLEGSQSSMDAEQLPLLMLTHI